MRSLTKKKLKVWLIAMSSILLATVLALSGVGIFLKVTNKTKNPIVEVNPLDFSIDAWDGKTVNAADFNTAYAGRSSNTRTIDSAASFVHFVNEVNKGNTFENQIIYLNTNIDLKGYWINSIGNLENPFKGTFDGGYYTILNANINGNGLFGYTEQAEVKNVGLYNSTIAGEEISAGLIGKAVNTNISNTFVRLCTINSTNKAGLVGEYVSNNGAHSITNSFVDCNSGYGLIYSLNTNNSSENTVTISQTYYTQGELIQEEINTIYIVKDKVIKPTNKSSFVGWSYSKNYEDGATWCDYTYLEGSNKLDFIYPVQANFVKVYLTGSAYESVVVVNNNAVDATNLAEAFKEADKTSEAEINLLVEKIFMEARAEVENNTTVTINALKDTTIVRGENNDDSMFVGTGNSKIILGSESKTRNTQPTITLDGNREEVEANNLTSGALVVSYGNNVEIHKNVTLQNNVNNNVGYGGAVLVYNANDQLKIDATISNCHAENGGGGICVVGTPPKSIGSIYNCSSNGNGGGACFIKEFPKTQTLKTMHSLYGSSKNIVPTSIVAKGEINVTGKNYSGNSNWPGEEEEGYGGAIYTEYALIFGEATTTFSENTAQGSGGAIYYNFANELNVQYANFESNWSGGAGGAICSIATINIGEDVSFISNKAQGSGGAICTEGSVNITGGAEFKENESTNSYTKGGALYIAGTETSTITGNVNFSSNKSYKSGGAIYLASAGLVIGKVNADGTKSLATFKFNVSRQESGGAIYSPEAVDIIGDAVFEYNEATTGFGGAIYMGATPKIEGELKFTRNIGGHGGGAIFLTEGDITIENQSSFTGNRISTSNYLYYGAGGAIHCPGNVTLKNVTFSECTADSNYYTSGRDYEMRARGGAVYCPNGDVVLENVSFNKCNVATETEDGRACSGGAVYAKNVTINDNVSFTNCEAIESDYASGKCGAIEALDNITIYGKNISFTGCEATDSGAMGASTINFASSCSVVVSKCTAWGTYLFDDSAIVGAASIVIDKEADQNCGVKFIDAIDYGSVVLGGGKITIAGSPLFQDNSDIAILCHGTLEISGSPKFIGNNLAISNGSYNNLVYGTENNILHLGNVIFTETSKAVFENNTRAIFVTSNGKGSGSIKVLGEVSFIGNDSSRVPIWKHNGIGFESFGGAAIFADAPLTFGSKPLIFKNNKSESLTEYADGFVERYLGGAIYAPDQSITIPAGSQFIGNGLLTVKGNAQGGAIYASSVTIANNVVFKDNYVSTNANAYGGAIYASVTIQGENVQFENNTAESLKSSSAGGGAISGSTTISSTNVSFINNTAKSQSSDEMRGGAIYSGTFYENTSSLFPAAFTMTVGQALFEGNTSSYGGAIYAGATSSIVGNVTFNNNTASVNGGAIYLDAGVLTLGATNGSNTAGFNGNTATTGNGGAIYAPTLKLYSQATFENNMAENQGGAIFMSTNSTLGEKPLTFINNKVETSSDGGAYGGAIRYNSSKDLKIPAGSTFTGNRAISHNASSQAKGGAIYINLSDLILSDNVQFKQNSVYNTVDNSKAYGGAVIINGGGRYMQVDGSNVKFEENGYYVDENGVEHRTNSGGAVYGHVNATKQVVFTKNKAVNGGAISRGGFPVGIEPGTEGYSADKYPNIEKMAIDKCWFEKNEASSNGGAIYTYAPISGNYSRTVNDGSLYFTNNKATNGGAIYYSGERAFVIGTLSSFSNNTATNYGGAIYIRYGVTCTMYGSYFGDNTATSGGAIYSNSEDSAISILLGEIIDNNDGYMQYDQGFDFYQNKATNSGGAIFTRGSISMQGNLNGTAQFGEVLDFYISFEDNEAEYGGAITANGNITAEIANFENNNADSGGAIFNNGSDTTVTTISNSVFDQNGLRVYNEDETAVGGAMYIVKSNYTISKCTFTNNGKYTTDANAILTKQPSSVNGGAIYAGPSSKIAIKDSSFSGNEAENGGAIYTLGQLKFEATDYTKPNEFKNNTATSFGGAILMIGTGSYEGNDGYTYNSLNNVTFDGNKVLLENSSSTARGGALYVNNVIIGYNVTFKNNMAYSLKGNGDGGAIYATGKIIFVGYGHYSNTEDTRHWSSSTFTNNFANHAGGAIYSSTTGSAIEIPYYFDEGWDNDIDCTFDSNGVYTDEQGVEHITKYGGAINLRGSIYTEQMDSPYLYHNITFKNNKASIAGGAIHGDTSSNSVFCGSFENNECLGNGGAINLAGTGSLALACSGFENNKAKNGGAINTSSSLSFFETYFSGNTAELSGGAINTYGSISIEGYYGGSILFYENTARARGGAICYLGTADWYVSGYIDYDPHSNVSWNFTKNKVTNETADVAGGAIYSQSANVTIGEFVYFHQNEAISTKGTGYGGAVAAYGSSKTLTLQGEQNYNNNKATTYGGAIYCAGSIVLADRSNDDGWGYTSEKVFNSNTASRGGAIYTASSASGITFNNTDLITFKNNSALANADNEENRGGAIYHYGTIDLTIQNAKFETNSSAKGGAIYVNKARTNIGNNVTFTGNTAVYTGGAIYTGSTSSATNIIVSGTNVTFNNNSAEGKGDYVQAHTIFTNASCAFGVDNVNETISITNTQTKGYEVYSRLGISIKTDLEMNVSAINFYVNNKSLIRIHVLQSKAGIYKIYKDGVELYNGSNEQEALIYVAGTRYIDNDPTTPKATMELVNMPEGGMYNYNDIKPTYCYVVKSLEKLYSQDYNYYYNGQVYTCIPEGYDESVMEIEGTYSTASYGFHDFVVKLKNGYKWNDGTTDEIYYYLFIKLPELWLMDDEGGRNLVYPEYGTTNIWYQPFGEEPASFSPLYKTGYVFKGYATEDGTMVVNYNNGAWSLAQNVKGFTKNSTWCLMNGATLYAVWELAPMCVEIIQREYNATNDVEIKVTAPGCDEEEIILSKKYFVNYITHIYDTENTYTLTFSLINATAGRNYQLIVEDLSDNIIEINKDNQSATITYQWSPTEDITLSWYLKEYYKVTVEKGAGVQTATFNYSENGVTTTNATTAEVLSGSTITTLTAVTESGYTFSGWYNGETLISNSTSTTWNRKVTSDIALTAKCEACVVTFDPNGGTVDTESKVVKLNEKYGTMPTPTYEGRNFLGWGGENLLPYPYVNTSRTDDNGNLVWTDNGDGSITVKGTNTTTSSYYGFIFTNTSQNKLNFEVGKKYVLTGKNQNSDLAVVFSYYNANNEVQYSADVVTWGEGFRFANLYLQVNPGVTVDETIYPEFREIKDENSIVETSENHTLTAVWSYVSCQINVASTNNEYGTVNLSYTTVDYGTKAIIEGNVIKVGNKTIIATPKPETNKYLYEFVGWTGIENGEIIKGNKNIKAEFKATAKTRTVSFDTGVEEIENPESIEISYGDIFTNLPILSREGYNFNGWWYNGDQIEDGETFLYEEDITLVAQWTAIEYTITCYLEESKTQVIQTITYTIESEDIILTEPTMEGYEFAGWVGTDLTEMLKDVTIANGSIGNREYMAKWYVEVEITASGNKVGNTFSVQLLDSEEKDLGTYTTIFKVIKDETYSIKAIANVLKDDKNYQILTISVDDVIERKVTSAKESELENGINSTIVDSKQISTKMLISFDYYEAYVIANPVSSNSLAGIQMEETSEDGVIVPYTGGYAVSNGTTVSFSIDTTPTEHYREGDVFIGFKYVVDGISTTAGRSGGTGIIYKSVDETGEYPKYSYSLDNTMKITELEVYVVQSVDVTINTLVLGNSTLTLKSEDNFIVIVDKDKSNVTLFTGKWEITGTTLSTAQLQEAFGKYPITTENGKVYVTILGA